MSARRRNLIVIATLLGTFLSAVDVTVVGTAMPTIIGALGGISHYSWVFSAYLVTSTTTIPIYGKLADLYGRRPVYIAAATLFLLGSALCGFSRSMEQLIAFRAIQGLGAGAIVPVTMTIIGDLFTIEQRAKMQGVVSAVWGVASVAGPAIGGGIVQFYGWPWVFYVNLPLGVLSIGLLWFSLKETIAHGKKVAIDYIGAATLTVAIVALLFALVEGGVSLPWASFEIVGMLVLGVVMLVAFIVHELRIKEPIVPLSLFASSRIIWSSYAANFLVGMAMMSVSSYVPLFAQGVMGGSAMEAGATVAPMSIGWTIMGALSGYFILRVGFRPIAILGTFIILGGSLLLTSLHQGSSQVLAIADTFTIGLGLGLCMTSYLLAVQNAVGWSERGVATSGVQFFRMMGNAVGVAALGTVLNTQMLIRLPDQAPSSGDPSSGLSQANVLLDPIARASLDPATLGTLRTALADSLNMVFWGVVVFAVLGVVATLLLPSGRIEEHAAGARSPID